MAISPISHIEDPRNNRQMMYILEPIRKSNSKTGVKVFLPLKHYVRNRPKLDKKYEIKQKYMHTSFDSAVSNTNSSYQAISCGAARKYNYYHKEVGWCNS